MAIAFYMLAQFCFVLCYRIGKQMAHRFGGYEALSTSSNVSFSLAFIADIAVLIWGFFSLSWWLPILSTVTAQVVGGALSVVLSKSRGAATASGVLLLGAVFAGLAYRYVAASAV